MLVDTGASTRYLVIIPAYNEEGVIGHVINKIGTALHELRHEILVVDDGSKDATAAEARAAGARVITLVENLGYGYALQTGYRFAVEHGYNAIIQMDGDGQHDPASIPDLLAPLVANEADVVIGSRALSSVDYPMPLARRVGQQVFTWLLKRLSGLYIGDPTSGFQVIGSRALGLYITDDFPGDYPDADVLLYLALRGLRVKEVPATFRVNERGTSMHGGILKPMYYVYKMSLSMVLVHRRHRRLARRKA